MRRSFNVLQQPSTTGLKSRLIGGYERMASRPPEAEWSRAKLCSIIWLMRKSFQLNYLSGLNLRRGGVGVPCSLMKTAVLGLIPGVDWNFSVFNPIFCFCFHDTYLGRQAFSSLSVSIFSCTAHTEPLPSFSLFNSYPKLCKINKWSLFCLCSLSLPLLVPSYQDEIGAARLQWKQKKISGQMGQGAEPVVSRVAEGLRSSGFDSSSNTQTLQLILHLQSCFVSGHSENDAWDAWDRSISYFCFMRCVFFHWARIAFRP